MRLSELKTGESAIIVKVFGHGGFRRRIMEMGFVRGKKITSILNAPLNDPIKYGVMGYEVSLRRSEADLIEIISFPQEKSPELNNSFGTAADAEVEQLAESTSHTINVALVGNPNSGKTSLFNALSGGHEHVGNYSGVTVDSKSGSFTYRGYKINITDLPGTYALSAYTPEELYVRRHLVEKNPDIVINSVVASNLERNLYLTCELIDINPPMVVALNMYDELQQSGAKLDYDCLGRMMGVPMIPVVARTGKGLAKLLDCVIAVYEGNDDRVRHVHINHSASIENGIAVISKYLKENESIKLPRYFPFRYLSMKLLEKDNEIEKLIGGEQQNDELFQLRDKLESKIENILNEDVETAITNEKYGFIEGALKETYTAGENDKHIKTIFIDRIVTNKYLGFPIFIALMFIMFSATFTLGAYPQQWIQSLVSHLSSFMESIMSTGPLKDLIITGIIGGVGSVIVFLPNILILYLFISIMEDFGYMARAAFIMDKIMHRIGLHGKSFIPLIMGFGCNVPAIMASRTIESKSSRIITILINPFMSCSARLPVLILLAGTFFPRHAGIVVSFLYFLGIVVAVVTAKLMRKLVFKRDETPFVMELPPYRFPTVKATIIHMWEKCAQYLRKIGGIILIAAIAIWFLSYYPRVDSGVNTATQSEHSYLGKIGKFCEPVMEPIGLNWKASVSLLCGTSAKEIIVSTMGVLYTGEDNASDSTLSQRIIESKDFTDCSALSYLIFILLYFPCVATLAAIANETGSWKWALFSLLYNTTVAWVVAFCVYNLVLLI